MASTRTTTKQPTMVLPPHERTDGEIRQDWLSRDIRVPRPLRTGDAGWREDHPPRVAGHSPYTDDRCHDGRHLFDVIESVIEHEVGEPHTDEFVGYQYEFRTVLTCVRCGRVMEWEGTRTEKNIRRVDPAPLTVGDLVAQQVAGDSSWGGRDMSTWHVYRDGKQVGAIVWGCGPRGRAYFAGRLEEWPQGETVEGPTPEAALKKLHRAAAKAQPAAAS